MSLSFSGLIINSSSLSVFRSNSCSLLLLLVLLFELSLLVLLFELSLLVLLSIFSSVGSFARKPLLFKFNFNPLLFFGFTSILEVLLSLLLSTSSLSLSDGSTSNPTLGIFLTFTYSPSDKSLDLLSLSLLEPSLLSTSSLSLSDGSTSNPTLGIFLTFTSSPSDKSLASLSLSLLEPSLLSTSSFSSLPRFKGVSNTDTGLLLN